MGSSVNDNVTIRFVTDNSGPWCAKFGGNMDRRLTDVSYSGSSIATLTGTCKGKLCQMLGNGKGSTNMHSTRGLAVVMGEALDEVAATNPVTRKSSSSLHTFHV